MTISSFIAVFFHNVEHFSLLSNDQEPLKRHTVGRHSYRLIDLNKGEC